MRRTPLAPVYVQSSSSDTFVPGLVSVVLAVHNGEADLQQAIESVLAQSYAPIELIAVDDGSTDGTLEVLQSFGERIQIVHQSNKGLPGARNTGLKHASGEFIVLMDHDDIWMPERIAVQIQMLRQFPEVGLCSSDFRAFNSAGFVSESYINTYYPLCKSSADGVTGLYLDSDVLEASSLESHNQIRIWKGKVYDVIAQANFVHPPTVMFRASLLSQCGGFNPAARNTCDWEWLARMARVTEFGYVDSPLIDYRLSETQMTAQRHRLSNALEFLMVKRMIWQRDSELVERMGEILRRQYAEEAISIAYEYAGRHPRTAWQLFFEATFHYRLVNKDTFGAALRLLIPTPVRRLAQRLRGDTSVIKPT
ncbi:MAG: glycosyltransferase family 2 protein [Planctomycetaceae bacterium]|nr:glycosyltransferase family 2 protein [Planctomycetaceae bacterium]